MDKFVVFTILCFLWVMDACGQRSNFKKLTSVQGLSHHTVYAITQDDKGFVWLGTREGLNRFDGNEIKSYYITGRLGGSTNQINALLSLGSMLYVGTNEGLYIYDQTKECFRMQKEIGKKAIRFLTRAGDHIFVGTKSGLFKLSNMNTALHGKGNAKGMAALDGDRFLLAVDDRLVIINGDGKEEYVFENKSIPQLYRTDFSVYQLYKDPKDRIWLATSHGVFHYDRHRQTFSKLAFVSPESMESRTVRSIAGNKKGELFIGTENGLYVYNLQTGLTHNYTQAYSDRGDKLNDEAIYSTFVGRDGTLWLGTYFGGVNYMPVNKGGFHNLLPGEGEGNLPGKAVSQLMEDSLHRIWISTEDGGLSIYDPARGGQERIDKYSKPFFLNTDNVHALHDDGMGNIWVGTFMGGLHRFNKSDRTTSIYTWDPSNAHSLSNNQVYSVFRDSRKMLWVGTQRGLNRFNYKTKEFSLFEAQVLGDKFIYDLTEDKNGDLWICTRYHGIYRYNPKDKSIINYTDRGEQARLKSAQVVSVYKDKKEQLWFGTLNGGACVYNIDKDSFQYYTTSTGLPNNNVYSILEDTNGMVWFSTNRGISRCDPQTGKIFNYDSKHGLSTNQFNFKSSLQASDGTFYFGSINGLNYFDPLAMDRSQRVQPLVFTDFQLFNQQVKPDTNTLVLKHSLEYTNEINLSYDQNVFTLNYVSIDYNQPGSAQYAYRLEGFEDNWNYVENKTSATYTNISPGNYTFRVRTLNTAGEFTAAERSISIQVWPPFYRSNLAYAFYAVLLGALAWGYTWFVRFLNHKQTEIQLAKLEKENMATISQHRTNFFTFISHEFKTPLTLVLASIDKLLYQQDSLRAGHSEMNLIKKNASKLFKLIHQLTEFRKIEGNDFSTHFTRFEIVSFVRQVVDSFSTLAAQKQLTIVLQTNISRRHVFFDDNKLETIFSNLLSNAVKFSKEGVISVRMEEAQNMMNFSITDTGFGISNKDLKFVFDPFYRSADHKDIPGTGLGMSLAANLVRSLHGHIEVSSALGKGTTVSFSLPIGARVEDVKRVKSEKRPADSLIGQHKIDSHKQTEHLEGQPTLLLVEDDKELLHFLSRHFQEKYTIIGAINGDVAWDKITKKMPDIILSDVRMPKQDGFELCLKLKQNKQFDHIPIILMSENQEDDHRINGLDVGADAYIGKPFKLTELDLLVTNMVQSRMKLKRHIRKLGTFSDHHTTMNNHDEDFMMRLNSVLEKLYADPSVSVEDIAEAMCVSRTSLHLNLKSKLNKTTGEVLNSYRLAIALTMLENNIPISEIAYRCGYSDANYFSRVFKKYYRLSPQKYKEEHFKKKQII